MVAGDTEAPVPQKLRDALGDRFELVRELGRGGMAVVYQARQPLLGREVAIKVLHPELVGTSAVDRFRREVEAIASLQHPNIIPIYAADFSDGFFWFSMPYIEGDTLEERMASQGPLPIDECIRIAVEIADALAYAHEQGLVHRDVKPANILFERGHALVADFGVAKAVEAAATPEVTLPGLTVGTVEYMSPEQATGSTALDHRSDLYSLGCVLYEMLTGEAPFTGPTAQSVLAKHVQERVPSPEIVRPTISPALSAVIRQTMAKVPADRFTTMTEFREALEAAATGSGEWDRDRRTGDRRRRIGKVAVAALGVVGAAWLLARLLPGAAGPDAIQADTTRLVVFPFEAEPGLVQALDLDDRATHALERWAGLSVVDPLQVRGLEFGFEGTLVQNPTLAESAADLGAGRFLRITAGRVGDAFSANGELREIVNRGGLLRSHSVRMRSDLADADSAIKALVDHLLFRGASAEGGDLSPGTSAFPAQQAFLGGKQAIQVWDLSSADSMFSEAAAADPSFSEAQLWVALSRAWRGLETAHWAGPASRAYNGTGLGARSRRLTEAIYSQAVQDFARACPLWAVIADGDPDDFVGWFGLGTCGVADSGVVPDADSPSGWRFRTSYHSTLQAFQRAFELHPPILVAYREGSFHSLRSLFKVGGNARRSGIGEGPDHERFNAPPAWRGDTLAFVPYPTVMPERSLTADPSEIERAVQQLRVLFHEVASAWAAHAPEDADAVEALAVARSILGDQTALELIGRARELVADEGETLRIAAVHVWMQLAFALPEDVEGIRRAKVLADSLLSLEALNRDQDPLLLAGLAALVGRGHLAAELVRAAANAGRLGCPAPLRNLAPALLIYAALGGPADSLTNLEARVNTVVDEAPLGESRQVLRMQWVARSATLAYAHHEMAAIRDLRGEGDYLLDFQAALSSGDTAGAAEGLAWVAQGRGELLPSSITVDALLPEAELFFLMGRFQDTAGWLDPTLRALPHIVPRVMNDPAKAAALVRAIGLRARAAMGLGDEEGASRWARAFTILWSDADPYLRVRVAEWEHVLR